MNFTFQGSNPGGTGMSTLTKQLILRTMHLSAILLFAVCLQVGATSTYGQATVSFTGKDVPLKTVFASVKKQTGYGVFFENGEAMLQSSAPVTLDLKNVSLDLFLRVCLKDQPLEYTMEGKTIFIKKKEPPVVTLVSPPSAPGDPILQIKGRVTNDKGEPLVNANITVKRTGHGTVTDANGNFYLRSVNSDDVVIVSIIGYKTQSILLKEKISLKVILQTTQNDLDRVVVQAYGTTSQRLATGNIGVIRSEDIEKQPVMNPLEALQGRIAGLVVSQINGYASAPFKVELRGRNAISSTQTGEPLYIIDGVPLTIVEIGNLSSYIGGSSGFLQNGLGGPASGQSPFFNIDPANIESIEVLKDADATSIYGSRASNGVILITTKKGKAGKTKLGINIYQGASFLTNHWNMLNTQQYISMRKEALQNDSITPDINRAPDLTVWDTTRYTNWQKVLWGGTGKVTNVQLNLSGGDVNTSFRLSAGYNRTTNILAISGADQRASVSLNINHRSLNQKLNLNFTSSYSYTQSNMIEFPASAATLAPNAPAIYDSTKNLNFAGWSPVRYRFPFGQLLQPYTAKTNFLNSNLIMSYEISKGLLIKSSFGYNTAQANQNSFTPILSQDPLSMPTGSATFGNNTNRNWIIEPQLEYSTFISSGKLNILLGGTTQGTVTEGLYNNGSGYTSDALLKTISNAPYQFSSDNYGEYRYAAFFGRISYNWENKYILNITARRDGSSNFGPGNQYGDFGSVGAAYIFTEETWFKKHMNFLSFGKLRSSYGSTGSEGPSYGYLTRFSSSNPSYTGIQPLVPTQHSNPNYHWQLNKKLEGAIDIGVFKDLINLSLAFYRDRCNNQLVAFPLPSFTGFPSVIANSPAFVQNSGLEISSNIKLIDAKNTKWAFTFNIGINRNKLLGYPNIEQSPYYGTLIIGQSLNIVRLLHNTGVDRQTGQYTFQDKNKDGIIDPGIQDTANDLYNYDLSPKFTGGFGSNFNYKSFSLSVFFNFAKQRGRNAFSGFQPGDMQNIATARLARWQKPGDNATYARFTTLPILSDIQYSTQSDGIYTDASFIRLANISLAYDLAQNLIKKIGSQNARIFFQAQNLFVLTKYKGIDPETQNFGGMPPVKIITTGISLNF